MRIQSLRIHGWKGVDVTIPWASAVVLFGPNDAGKTNVLDGVMLAFSYEEPEIPGAEQGWQAEVVVELPGLGIDGAEDQLLLASWIATAVEVDPERYAPLREKLDEFDAAGSAVDAANELIEAFFESLLVSEVGRITFDDVVSVPRFRVGVDYGNVVWQASDRFGTPETPLVLDQRCEAQRSVIRALRVGGSSQAVGDLHKRVEGWLWRALRRAAKPASEGRPPPTVGSALPDLSIGSSLTEDRWLERAGGDVRVRREIVAALDQLAERATELAPRFLTDRYGIAIEPSTRQQSRIQITLVPQSEQEIPTFELELASAGIRAWVVYAISEALRESGEEPTADHGLASPRYRPPTMLSVFDEPELHLHPLAQEEAAAWVAARADDASSLLLASHAPAFLDLPLESAKYVRVFRTDAWETRAERIPANIMSALKEGAEGLGLSPVALIQLTRAWLVVEGEHDRKVVEAFYGQKLGEARIEIIRLHGAVHAKRSLTAEALRNLGIPFKLVLDNVRAVVIDGSEPPETQEEKIVVNLLEAGADVRVRGLPYPDIICALPEREVVEVIQTHRKDSPSSDFTWAELIDRHRAQSEAREPGDKPPNFKSFALDALGWKRSPDLLIDKTLERCEGVPRDGDPLARIIEEVIAEVTPQGPQRPSESADDQTGGV